jgi:hypothetical protein
MGKAVNLPRSRYWRLSGRTFPGVESVRLGRGRPSNLRLRPGYATHAVTQMHRAVAQRGLNCEPIEPRAEQRFPEVALEALLEQVAGAVVARCD